MDPKGILFMDDKMTLSKYEVVSQSGALQQFYLSSLVTGPEQMYLFENIDRSDGEYLSYLRQVRHHHLSNAVPAQLALAFRFEHGISVPQNCDSSLAYMEQPARLATEFVDRTHGLDTIEKEPLNLLGPSYLPDGNGMMLDS